MYTNTNHTPPSPPAPYPYVQIPPPQPPAYAAAPMPAFAESIARSGSAGPRSTAEGSAESIDPRLKTAGLAILGSALVLLVGALTKSWFVASGKDGGLGLLGLESCHRGMCHSVSWFDVPRVPSEIPIFATTALIACAATVVMLIHTGAMLLQGAAERVRLRYLVPAISSAVLGSCAFVASLAFGDNARGITLGWSTVVAFAGLLATGITTLVMVRPLTRTA